NVGKSSVINTLKHKKVAKAAPVPGETKVWQYITLFRKIFLVDCPGVVYPSGDTESDIVLKVWTARAVFPSDALQRSCWWLPTATSFVLFKNPTISPPYHVSKPTLTSFF